MMRNKVFAFRSKQLNRLMMILTIFSLVFGNQGSLTVVPVLAQSTSSAPVVAAPVSTMNLAVKSANDSSDVVKNLNPLTYNIHKGDAITQFKYIINIDNTGTTEQRSPNPGTGCSPKDAGYPDSCHWVSIAGAKSTAPIYTQGTQADFPGGVFTINGNPVSMPAGRYLISILADNYKIDGAHFTVPGSGNVTVEMQPYDLPTGTIQSEVFEDNAPTNSAPDVPAERGIAGFTAHISDYLAEVTTDVFGKPLCGDGHCVSKCYVVDGGADTGTVAPIDALGHCPFLSELGPNPTTLDTHVAISSTAVIEGKVKIPNLGTDRYTLSVVPPSKSGWVQTTTLEGNHDWDSWVMEGSTGLDTEFVVAGEPFPAINFGYVRESNSMGAGTGVIKGSALAVSAYIPPVGGIGGEAGLLGAKPKDKNPIKSFYVSVSDLNNNDQTVFMKHFDCVVTSGGCPFAITGVPAGDYVLGIWDEPQDYIFGEQNVSIAAGETVDIGAYSMLGWWTTIEGHVFNDLNGNGKMDAGEPGIPNFVINMKTRENSVMDRGTTSVTTDANGYYWMESAYPITQWLVEEAYIEGFQTTGVTYQADNQPTETTIIGKGVDVNLHPVIGLGGRLDWGVKAYDSGKNGGIVGTATYDTTRNETNAAQSVTENWQPGIPNLKVDLFAPVDCVVDPATGLPLASVNSLPQICDPSSSFQLAADGSYKLGNLLNQYDSETWQRPSGCIARDVNGNPLQHGVDEQVLPLDPNAPCLEAPLMSVQFGPMQDSQGTPNASFGATVDGNYGFGDGCFGPGGFDTTSGACADHTAPTSLPSNSDYIVKVEIPNDSFGRPLYKVTKEEDINIFTGDTFVPQNIPSACAGPLHTVDVKGAGTDNYPANTTFIPGVTVPASTPVDNPNYAASGLSPYEGQPMPLCDAKLVHVADRRSVAPNFNLFTDVPVPARFWGLIVDDLNFSSNPKSVAYGEKLPVSFAPVGVYDYTNRLITTVESDFNGLWDVLLPSTNRISCPTPSGVCATTYRFVGNDPGTPGKWNANYDPQYRTIAAEFEAFPGLTLPADLAPSPVAVAVQIPGVQTIGSVACYLNDPSGATAAANPEFFSIDKPYMRINDAGGARSFTITGLAFGSAAGSVMLDNFAMDINSWSDRQITFSVPASGINVPSTGPHQLKISTALGSKSTINALTFHVLNNANSNPNGSGIYNPAIFEVGVGKTYDPTAANRNTNGYEHALQDALNAATASSKALVVVYPGPVDNNNPRYNGRGAYYENLILHSQVKLQGVGPGGVYPTSLGLPPVQGSIIDGIGFGGDSAMADGWRTLVGTLTWPGNQAVSEGEVIYVLPGTATQFTSGSYAASIDGLDIRGGDQMGFPGNLNAIFGGFTGPAGGVNVETQGGAIFANSYAHYLGITNNIVENNGGTYGTIRVGTPNVATSENSNDHVRIANNRIIANGGTNLAGAIGLFGGSDNYVIANNDLCGNFSAEYGGAISHFGKSNAGSIHDNRIYFNHSYDEGAGIMIAGELATNPTANYGAVGGPQGSGAVDIYNNLIQANMSEDDGGGLRFLMAGNFPMNVYNNMIVNNVSTHEGGGVAIDDAPNVRFFNNTVMNNKTTATAITSNGLPAPAGLSTSANSHQLQATLPLGATTFGSPLMFNNIFWDNRAGSKGTNTVTGIGSAGDLTPINYWDLGTSDGSGLLSITNSILQSTLGTVPSPTNSVGADPLVNAVLDIPLLFTSWRTNINFTGAIMVSADLPPQLLSDYHLSGSGSPAYNLGAASIAVPAYQQPGTTLNAPSYDIDNQARPALGGFDAGADEFPGPIADLSITKTDGVTSVQPGGAVHYTITVSNAGPDAANLAPVVDNVPAALTGVTWACAVPATSGYACGAVSGTNSINTTVNLPAGGSATFTVNGTVAAAAAGTLTNTATVATAAGTTDLLQANNSATDSDAIVRPADLSITKTDGVSVVSRGNQIRYTIVVSNAGPFTATGALVSDNFPGALNGAINWTCATTGGATCGGTGGNQLSGSGTINRTVNLPVGSTITFTTTSGSVSTTTLAPTLVNTATVTAPAANLDPNTANNSATDTDTINGVHVGDLNWTSGNTSATQWAASVTVSVHDANHNPVAGVAVSGAWLLGGSGGNSCITNAAGQCTLSRAGLSRTSPLNASVLFTVTNLSSGTLGYQVSLNHDPDTGAQASNGTFILVPRPPSTAALIDPPASDSVIFLPAVVR